MISARKKIAIFGDSVMRGVLLDHETKRYYFRKDDQINQFEDSFQIEVDNRSKFGCTIEKGERMLTKALEKGLSCDMMLLEYGGNDCDYDWEAIAAEPNGQYLPHTPLPAFEAAYRRMIQMLRDNHIQPIVMSLPPIDAEKYFDWFTRNGASAENILRWLGDKQLVYRHQELYSATAVRIAGECDCLCVDARTPFLARHDYKELLCDDGIHPNEKGHQLIYRVFADLAGKAILKLA